MPSRPRTPSLTRVFEPDGALSRELAGYEHRPQQLEMSSAVADALATARVCLVEAGTGVGKSIAYLVPVLMAAAHGKRTVISTHTIGLQHQLMHKDIPLAQRVLPTAPLRPVMMKGRGNYLCLQNLDAAEADIFNVTDPQFGSVKQWAAGTQTGDRDELPFRWPGWAEVAADHFTCPGRPCRYYDRCHYFRMRREAQDANLFVVNHALLLSDLVVRGADPAAGVIPAYDFVVIDEAHHLEDVATDVFGVSVDDRRIPSLLDRLKRTRGLDYPPERLAEMETINAALFTPFALDRPQFMQDEAVDGEARDQVADAAGELCTRLEVIARELLDQSKDAEDEALRDRLTGLSRLSSGLADELTLVVSPSVEEGHIRWAQRWGTGPEHGRRSRHAGHTALIDTPIFVGSLLEERLWTQVEAAVLTSATLSNSGGFSYIRSRLSVPEDAIERIVGSPFDFTRQCMLYVPGKLAAPPRGLEPGWADAAADEIERVVTLTRGRAFLLFTSRRMLEAVYERLQTRLPYALLKQGDRPPGKLLEEFRENGEAVLFGTQTFWEGVDVQGDALSCVVIDRLPFAVPDSPIQRARTDRIREEGGDWFNDYSMPQAQLRLKQGFGRLIRTRTDRGIVCILDTRLINKGYGSEFVRYLPPASRASLWPRVQRFWLDGEDDGDP